MSINLHKAEFVKSAASPKDFIESEMPCVVFAGKSNVGKSSVINKVLLRRNFARVGASPGKTIHVNYFNIDEKLWLADLPGYGYAKVSKSERERWGILMERFFAVPERVSLGILIVDMRHKPTEGDATMARWFLQTGRPMTVVANKQDKLKKSEVEPSLSLIRETLSLPQTVPVIPFSAEKGTGRELLLAEIEKLVQNV